MLPLTDYATKRSGVLHGESLSDLTLASSYCEVLTLILEHEPEMWDGLRAQFLDHLDEVNAELRTVGAVEIDVKAA
jgi:homogentisate 1,2-dioxygenase